MRYETASEFVTLMKYLWTCGKALDFAGDYGRDHGGYVVPKAVRKPRPTLTNAGRSEVGFGFAGLHSPAPPVAPCEREPQPCDGTSGRRCPPAALPAALLLVATG